MSADTAPNSAPIDFQVIFELSPNPYVLLAPDFTIVGANRAYLQVTARERVEIVGRNMFEAFPGGPHDPDGNSVRQLRASLDRVLRDREPDTIALIRYAIPSRAQDGTDVFEERYWSATHTPVLDEAGNVSLILQHTVDVTEFQQAKEATSEADAEMPGLRRAGEIAGGVFQRAQVVEEEKQILDLERKRLRRLFEQAPGFVAFLQGPQHKFQLVNQAYRQLVGRSDLIGSSVKDVLPEVQEQGFLELLDQVFRTGEPYIGHGIRALLKRQKTEPPEERFLDFIFQPIFRGDGSVSGIFVQGNDVTERTRAEAHQRLLIDELNHRVKNTLATVQSIATQTLRNLRTPEVFRDGFLARLRSLSHTHNLLSVSSWRAASLREVIKGEVQPYDDADSSRVLIDGIDVQLPPRAALALGMAFHELTTNAAKYGALSVPDGTVAISWRVDPADGCDRLSLEWRERDGPEVRPPGRRGFGSILIERGLAHEVDGEVHLAFEPSGVHCTMMIPLTTASDVA